MDQGVVYVVWLRTTNERTVEDLYYSVLWTVAIKTNRQCHAENRVVTAYKTHVC